ncbi:MAG: CinA family protein [Anaerolineae bacterium]
MAEPLEVTVGKLLIDKKLTLSLAESCTGGLIGHRITDVAGSSDYFMGGVVAYSYDAKEKFLNVRHDTLYDHGAVSTETAVEMARGARRAFGTDIGISVTGIAGPGGGMPGKPVGLVYICLSTRQFERTEKYVWQKDRVGNKWDSSEAALTMLKEYLDSLN